MFSGLLEEFSQISMPLVNMATSECESLRIITLIEILPL